jgi:alpha-2-macroglobulin
MTDKRQHTVRSAWATLIVVGLLVPACSDDKENGDIDTTVPTSATGATPAQQAALAQGDASQVMQLSLSEGTQQQVASEVKLVTGEQLDQQTIDAIIARLSPWEGGSAEVDDFQLPVSSLTPPRVGTQIAEPFPPPPDDDTAEVPVPDDLPLDVVRFNPVGDVALAPYITITFNQPMVPVGTVGQVSASDAPAVIEPELPGAWQWIGTRTARFDFQPPAGTPTIDRLPMASGFTVTVPAGTAAANGASLASAVSFEFATPAAQAMAIAPAVRAQYGIDDDGSRSLPTTPIFIVTFDQAVDPQAVAEASTLTVGDDDSVVALRPATADEVAADEIAAGVTGSLPSQRWVALRPVDALPTDSSVTVTVGPNVPSAEGPLTSDASTAFSGRTYAPLKVRSISCNGGGECAPGASLAIEFNNVIDVARHDPSSVVVDPPLAGQVVGASGTYVWVYGSVTPRGSHRVSVAAGAVTDVFGQTLSEPAEETLTISAARPSLQPINLPLITLDPLASRPSLPVQSINHDTLRLRVWQRTPQQWPDFKSWFTSYDNDGNPLPPSQDWGRPVVDTEVTVDGAADRFTETSIDLSDYLDNSSGRYVGHLLVVVEPAEGFRLTDDNRWENQPIRAWVQSTDLAPDGFADSTNFRTWVTSMSTGTPVSGVELRTLTGSLVGTTDADGLAVVEAITLDLGGVDSRSVPTLVAAAGNDTALLTTSPQRYNPYGYEDWLNCASDDGCPIWSASTILDSSRWYVTTDRGIYRPGETVSVKGLLRRVAGDDGGLSMMAAFGGDMSVDYQVFDSYGNEIATGSTAVSALGGFDLAVEIPAAANLGYASISFTLTNAALPQQSFGTSLRIEEFRRPEFEVVARTESVGPHVSTAPATLAATAAYYAGGPLGDAPVTWQVSTSQASYAPPGWGEYSFGVVQPWWYGSPGFFDGSGGYGDYYGGGRYSDPCCWGGPPPEVSTYEGRTDGTGTHYLKVDFAGQGGALPDLPVSVSANAAVEDVNRQVWASSTSLLVHPADRYVGVRAAKPFVRVGETLEIDVIATDIDGAAVAGQAVSVIAGRLSSTWTNGEYLTEVVDPQTCELTSTDAAQRCSFTTEIGGTYRITSTLTDAAGGRNRTETTVWVQGSDAVPDRRLGQQSLTVVPNGTDYQPGDTAELLVISPFASGEGVAVISSGAIERVQRFSVTDGSAIVTVEVGPDDLPQLAVDLEVVGTQTRVGNDGLPLDGAAPQPAFATGAITLPIGLDSRRLTVDVATPQSATTPGATTDVTVTVTDPSGAPVAGAEVALIAVDESVLAVAGFQLPDPLTTFYTPDWQQRVAMLARDSVLLASPDILADKADSAGFETEAPVETAAAAESAGDVGAVPSAAPTGGGVSLDTASRSAYEPTSAPDAAAGIGERSNFDALAVFAPQLGTAADGTVVVPLTLPDSLTRYRLMAVVADDAQRFGSGEANLTARLPLMVRPSAPRFANFGDAFELPVVVQNQTDQPMDVDVVLQTANLGVDSAAVNGAPDPAVGGAAGNVAGQRVSVPANDRIEVRFPVRVDQVGTAAFRVAATQVGGAAADAVTTELPVYTPATTESFATYGVVDGDATVAQPVLAPTDVWPQFGGLEVTTSSTAVQALTDAVLYLNDYRYESSDALASQILTVASLRDVLDAFDAPGLPSPELLDRRVNDKIAQLANLQRYDGGWSFWSARDVVAPYNTVHVMHALTMARKKGYSVPANVFDLGLQYLVDIENYIPADYSRESREMIIAYSIFVLELTGKSSTEKAEQLFRSRRNELPLDAIAWLWPSITDESLRGEIATLFANRTAEIAGAANFTTGYRDGSTNDSYLTLASDRRTDGIVLDALLTQDPTNDLIPKVVAGLLGGRTKGRWTNVSENSFILLALNRYFETAEGVTPEFIARVWLGDQFVVDAEYRGRTTESNTVMVPTQAMIDAGDANLVIQQQGSGRLYYRIAVRYAPESLDIDALDRGFTISRTYEAVDDPDDVTLLADGTWQIRAGARVRVTVTMVAEAQRTHVALIDPLAAGTEILNPELGGAEALPVDEGEYYYDPYGTYAYDCPLCAGLTADVGIGSTWWGPWFEHQNRRDDRAEAFASVLPGGVYEYRYVVRATTPGEFVVPPARAEEIYAPETFGRSASDRITIVD